MKVAGLKKRVGLSLLDLREECPHVPTLRRLTFIVNIKFLYLMRTLISCYLLLKWILYWHQTCQIYITKTAMVVRLTLVELPYHIYPVLKLSLYNKHLLSCLVCSLNIIILLVFLLLQWLSSRIRWSAPSKVSRNISTQEIF